MHDVTATSVTISWKLEGNNPCGNQLVITIVYTRLISCQEKISSDFDRVPSLKGACSDGESGNVSLVLESNRTSFTKSSLVPNSAYKLVLKLRYKEMCESLTFTGTATFNTLKNGKSYISCPYELERLEIVTIT